MAGLLIALTAAKGPNGVIIRVELLAEILSVLGDIDEHDSACCGFNGLVSLRNNGRAPRTGYKQDVRISFRCEGGRTYQQRSRDHLSGVDRPQS